MTHSEFLIKVDKLILSYTSWNACTNVGYNNKSSFAHYIAFEMTWDMPVVFISLHFAQKRIIYIQWVFLYTILKRRTFKRWWYQSFKQKQFFDIYILMYNMKSFEISWRLPYKFEVVISHFDDWLKICIISVIVNCWNDAFILTFNVT